MNYGYDSTTAGYRPSRKRKLATCLSELCAQARYVDGRGMKPYVEVDAMYPGVRIRRITHLTPGQEEELLREADEIFERVME